MGVFDTKENRLLTNGYVLIFKREDDGTYSYQEFAKVNESGRVDSGKYKREKIYKSSMRSGRLPGNIISLFSNQKFKNFVFPCEKVLLDRFSSYELDLDSNLLFIHIPQEIYDDQIRKIRFSKGLSSQETVEEIKRIFDIVGKNVKFISVGLYGYQICVEYYFNRTYENSIVNNKQEAVVSNNTSSLRKENIGDKKKDNKFDKPKINEFEEKNKSNSNTGQMISNSQINSEEIINNIKKKLIGQDATISAVVNKVCTFQICLNDYEFFSEEEKEKIKANILIDGPTGTGKTFLITELAKQLSLPVFITSINVYSPASYKGINLDQMLVGLLNAANGDLELAQRGIIVLDEIDKLGSDDETLGKRSVQLELLTYLQGAKFDIQYKGKTISFDTSKITFVGLGAFTDLREQKISQLNGGGKRTIGFSVNNPSNNSINHKDYYIIDTDDYIKAGLAREFVGRFTLKTATQDLSPDKLVQILKEGQLGPLYMFEKQCQYFKVKLLYDDNILYKIAEMAYEKGTGARALKEIFEQIEQYFSEDIINHRIDEIRIEQSVLDKVASSVHRKVPQKRGAK